MTFYKGQDIHSGFAKRSIIIILTFASLIQAL